MLLELKPRRRQVSPVFAHGLTVEPSVGDDELVELLVRDASRVRFGPAEHFAGALVGGARSLREALWLLEEGAHWEPTRHPRWPAGTPGGLGGQFMHVGQRFRLHGVEYDVAAVLPGKIWAHVATHGMKTQPKLVEIPAAEIEKGHFEVPGVERPEAEVPYPGEHYHSETTTMTVIDAYAHPETHDPSIPVPENAPKGLTEEKWQRFGKLDQERYSQLMERLGPWTAGASPAKIMELRKTLDSDAVKMVESAYHSQYSVGSAIHLTGVLGAIAGWVKGDSKAETGRKKFEAARFAQSELASAVQWDLYNRTLAPDIAVFKGHNENNVFTTQFFKEGKPVFPGASFSQYFRPPFWGNNKFAAKMAVRNIALSTLSGYVGGGGFDDEQEVSVPDPWLAKPGFALNFPSVPDDYNAGGGTHPQVTSMQAKWLESVTHKGASGEVLDMLLQSYEDGGENLPVTPPPLTITMDGVAGTAWKPPPPEAIPNAYVGGVKVPVVDLEYDEVDEAGRPVAHKVKEMVSADQLQIGDYIEGLKGTRYIVIPDKADSYLGMRYYKLTEPGAKIAGSDFKVDATGQDAALYEKGTPYTAVDAYEFEGGGETAFRKLKGHFDWPVEAAAATEGFHPEAWAESAMAQAKFLSKYGEGEKFVEGGIPYEVVVAGHASVKVKNLQTGKMGTASGGPKLPPLVLKPGWTESGQAHLSADNYLAGPVQELGAAFDALTPGAVFKVGQTLWQAKQQTPDGHVVALVVGMAHEPAEHELKKFGTEHTFAAGQKLQVMTEKPMGWKAPQVGDTLALEGAKATLTKVLKDGTLQFKKQGGGVEKLGPADPRLAFVFSPGAWEYGAKVKLKTLAVGEKFHGGTGQKLRPYQVVEAAQEMPPEGKLVVSVRNLDTGEEIQLSAGKSYVRLIPKQLAQAPVETHATPKPVESPGPAFQPDEWQAGGEVKVSELSPGEKFSYQGQSFELVAQAVPGDDPVTLGGGTGQAKNLATGEVQTFNSMAAAQFSVSKLVPKEAEPWHSVYAGWSEQTTKVAKLDVGDQFAATDPVHPLSVIYEVTGQGGVAHALATTYKVVSSGQPEDIKPGESGTLYSGATASWVKKAAAEGVPGPPAALPQLVFDPAAYVKGLLDATTYGDLHLHDVVQGKKGDYFLITDVSKPDTVRARNLVTGKDTKFKKSVKPAYLLKPKSETETPYEDLVAGDPVKLGALLAGDQFNVEDSTYEVVSAADGDGENATVAPVTPGGGLGTKTNVGSYPLLVVTLHAKSEDKLKATQAQAQAVLTDPSKLPAYEGFQGYAWHKSGSHDYPKIAAIAEGCVFQDKTGTLLKMKMAGPSPVVTDGKQLFAIDGGLRGLVVEKPFLDESPGTVSDVGEVEAAIAAPAMSMNPEGLSLDDLKVEPGDWIQAWGKAVKVTAVDKNGSATYYNPADGSTYAISGSVVPSLYAKQTPLPGEPPSSLFEPAPPTEPAPLSAPVAGWQPNAKTLHQLKLEPGDKFKYEGGTFEVDGDLSAKVIVPLNSPNATAAGESTGWNGSTVPTEILKSAPALVDGGPEPGAWSEAGYTWAGDKTLGTLEPGDIYVNAESAAQSSLWKVASKSDTGLTVSKEWDVGGVGVGETNTLEFGESKYGVVDPEKAMHTFQSPMPAAGELIPPLVPNAENGTVGALPVGSFVKSGISGAVYKKLGPGVAGDTVKLQVVVKVEGAGGIGVGETFDNVADWVPHSYALPSPPPAGGPVASVPTTPTPAPEPGAAPKKLAELGVGDLVTKSGWGGPVYRIVEDQGEGKFKLEKVKAGFKESWDVMAAEKVVDATNWQGQSFVQFSGPLWKPGEYVKLVKPGNKTGKTARVSAVSGGGYTVLMQDGSSKVVGADWFQPVKGINGATVKKLYLPTVKLSSLKPGDVFAVKNESSGYWGEYASVPVVKEFVEVLDSGKVKTKTPGTVTPTQAYSSQPALTPDLEVEPLWTIRNKMAFGTPNVSAPGEAPAHVALVANKNQATLAQLETGDVYESPGHQGAAGTVWKLLTQKPDGGIISTVVSSPSSAYTAGEHEVHLPEHVPGKVGPEVVAHTAPTPAAKPAQTWMMTLSKMPVGTKYEQTIGITSSFYTVKSYVKYDVKGKPYEVHPWAATAVHVVGDDGDDAYYPLDSVHASKQFKAVSAPPLKVEDAKVGDQFVSVYNGQTFEVTEKTPTAGGTTPAYHMTLKNVKTGETGSGYYTGPQKLGDVSLIGEEPALPEPLAPSVEPLAEPVQMGDFVQSGGVKKWGELQPGDVYVAKGYENPPHALYKVTAVDSEGFMSQTIAPDVEPPKHITPTNPDAEGAVIFEPVGHSPGTQVYTTLGELQPGALLTFGQDGAFVYEVVKNELGDILTYKDGTVSQAVYVSNVDKGGAQNTSFSGDIGVWQIPLGAGKTKDEAIAEYLGAPAGSAAVDLAAAGSLKPGDSFKLTAVGGTYTVTHKGVNEVGAATVYGTDENGDDFESPATNMVLPVEATLAKLSTTKPPPLVDSGAYVGALPVGTLVQASTGGNVYAVDAKGGNLSDASSGLDQDEVRLRVVALDPHDTQPFAGVSVTSVGDTFTVSQFWVPGKASWKQPESVKTPGQPVVWAQAVPGDVVKSSVGNFYEVEDVGATSAGYVPVKGKFLGGPGEIPGNVGKSFPISVLASDESYTWASKAEVPDPAAAVPETAGGTLTDPLEPFKYHKAGSGKGKPYTRIGKLGVGDTFKDKTGSEYLVAAHVGDQVQYTLKTPAGQSAGPTYSTAASNFVRFGW